jgi:hypothetical protein
MPHDQVGAIYSLKFINIFYHTFIKKITAYQFYDYQANMSPEGNKA